MIEEDQDAPPTFAQRMADTVALVMGSWRFVLGQILVFILWIAFGRFIADPFPFIFFNLLVGMVSSLSAPLILMAQNRQEVRAQQTEDRDLDSDLRSEERLQRVERLLHERLDGIDASLREVQQLCIGKDIDGTMIPVRRHVRRRTKHVPDQSLETSSPTLERLASGDE